MSDKLQSSILAYHQRTKHRFEAFAEGPGQLDWDAQPAAFRHYVGAPVFELPLAGNRYERAFGALGQPPETEIAPDIASLGALLELSLGISAWKSWGPNRWALRCNPSSGNLHPVEAYVLATGLPGVPDGLHHYDAEQHALEGRARCPAAGDPWLAVALTSAMWRESWKYGERAFRYCQLDIGHAIGALAYAAALLGWRVEPRAMTGENLFRLLGLDRPDDFPPSRYAYTEAEEPEILLTVRAPRLGNGPEDPAAWISAATWQGRPSIIDPAPGYRWPAVSQAAASSREAGPLGGLGALPTLPPLPPHPANAGAVQLIRQRRSGQRFDPQARLSKAAFYRLLDAILPRKRAPFTGQEITPGISLLLFVQRVDGLPPGLYLLPRTEKASSELLVALAPRTGGKACRAVIEFDPDCPRHLGLMQLNALGLQEVQRLARSLCCHQDIAATGAFSLGMLADFEDLTDAHAYRQRLREAGLIGQALYLEAEAAGIRGTGIGCFFDDPVSSAAGLQGARWQSVYHFTLGTPIIDSRIETGPPYPQRQGHEP